MKYVSVAQIAKKWVYPKERYCSVHHRRRPETVLLWRLTRMEHGTGISDRHLPFGAGQVQEVPGLFQNTLSKVIA